MMCGGPPYQDARHSRQAIAGKVKSQLEEKENRTLSIFKAVSYRSQVVAGTDYLIKMDVGDDEFMHLRVFQSIPHENKPPTLQAYQTKKASWANSNSSVSVCMPNNFNVSSLLGTKK